MVIRSRYRFRVRHLSVLIIALAMAGCRGKSTDTATVSEADDVHTPDATEVSSTDVDATGSEDEIAAGHLASVGADSSYTTEKVPSEWNSPLGEDDNFFAAPTVTAQVQQVEESDPEQDSVRLIGFVYSDGLSSASLQQPRAILKIGESMVFMETGESKDGVELLGIEHRTVNLQRGRDRWSLALLDQPVVNQAIAPRTPNRRQSRPARTPVNQVPVATIPDPEPRQQEQPASAQLPEMDLSDIELPDLPELPDMEEMLNLDL